MRRLTPVLPAAFFVLLLAGCPTPGGGGGGPDGGCCSIGKKFEWGTATAAYQIEGGNKTSDWWQWEQRCKLSAVDGVREKGETITDCESNLDGPDAWDLYDSDFAEAEKMGHNAYRMSIEWAKIEPTQGQYDQAVIAHYHDIMDSARAHGLRLVVTLLHVTLPEWVQNLNDPSQGLGGWVGPAGSAVGKAPIVDAFAKFAGDMAEEFGGEVDLWITLNEPLVSLVAGYVSGDFPPGDVGHVGDAVHAAYNEIYAHAKAYDAIHARDTVDADGDGVAASVSIAKHWRIFDPKDPSNQDDVHAADRLDYVFNRLFVNAITKGTVDLDANGDTKGPGEKIDPTLENKLDWLGINYYGRYIVAGPTIVLDGIEIPVNFEENPDPSVPHSDLGWEIYPTGFTRTLEAAASYGLPIRVTENGIADDAGDKRPGFIVSHVKAMQKAMADGVDVRGYYFWSLMDNFEWAEGYYPRFGLLKVDYTDPARPRTETLGAKAYSEIIKAGGVTPAIEQSYGTLGN